MLQPRAVIYDRSRDSHYNLISALHKSIRGSDADASLYWLQRMIDAGENPHYILKRKEQSYGKGYIYDHDTAEGFSGQNYFPDKTGRKQYYTPTQRGFEKGISKRLNYWQKLRQKITY